MVLLFENFTSLTNKLSSKLKRRHSASFLSFESEILNYLYQLSLHSKPGSKECSVSWTQTCLRVFPNIEKSFAEFITEVDYPVTEWNGSLVEEYLKGSLSLLDNFNSISSSVNHMSQACMELSYALSHAEASPTIMLESLKEIQPWCAKNISRKEGEVGRVCSEKELEVHKALLARNRVNNLVCRIIDSSICGGGEVALDCNGVSEVVKEKGVVKDVDEINKGVVQILAAAKEGRYSVEFAEELRGKVEVLRMLLEGVKEDVNRVFSEAMVWRAELLGSFQNKKN